MNSEFNILANVKEHATLSAGASVDHGVEVGVTGEHVNRAADRGCRVSTCSASDFLRSLDAPDATIRAFKPLPSGTLIRAQRNIDAPN